MHNRCMYLYLNNFLVFLLNFKHKTQEKLLGCGSPSTQKKFTVSENCVSFLVSTASGMVSTAIMYCHLALSVTLS